MQILKPAIAALATPWSLGGGVSEVGTCKGVDVFMHNAPVGCSDVPALELPKPVTHPSRLWKRAGVPNYYEKVGTKGQKVTLGEGVWGKVYKGWDAWQNRYVAVKETHSPSACYRLRVEARHLESLHHPNIVNILAFGEAGDKAFLVMPLVGGKRWDNVKERKNPRKRLCTLYAGLAYMHRQGIVHNDLHEGNVMVDNDTSVIIDFGLARKLDDLEEFEFSADLWCSRQLVANYFAKRMLGFLWPSGAAEHPDVVADHEAFVYSSLYHHWEFGAVPSEQALRETALCRDVDALGDLHR